MSDPSTFGEAALADAEPTEHAGFVADLDQLLDELAEAGQPDDSSGDE